MPAAAITGQSTAGGGVLLDNKKHNVYVNGKLAAVGTGGAGGTQVTSHGAAPHASARCAVGSNQVFLGRNQDPMAREGDLTTCGHAIINCSTNVYVDSGPLSATLFRGRVNSPAVYEVTDTVAPAWGGFMNQNAVFGAPGDISRSVYLSFEGNFRFLYMGTGATFFMDGAQIATSSQTTGTPAEVMLRLEKGYHIIRVVCGSGGWAINLRYALTGQNVWTTRSALAAESAL